MLLSLILLLGLAAAAAAQPAPPVRHWLEITARGPELRLVTPHLACPDALVDGQPAPMDRRAAANDDFPITVCQLLLAPGVRRAAIGDWTAPLPKAEPRRVLIFGDTGCRLKGAAVQACNDPRLWPFALVAAKAAAMKPDLVIHVGDYWYRESPCPAGVAGCAGSPHGDNWTTWDAEFFAPAEPLLSASPWVFARGNHESCARGGPGWFRLLDQAPEPLACPADSAPFRVGMGDTSLYVLDSAESVDASAPGPQVAQFAGQLDALGAELDHGKGWIITHRPIWGLVPVKKLGPLGALEVELNKTEQAAVRGRALEGVQMVVSGHIHHFAAYDFAGRRPAQLIVGTGGDIGEPADSARIKSDVVSLDGLDARRFGFDRYGYLLLDRSGADWTGVFRDLDDKVVATCRLHLRQLTCKRPPSKGGGRREMIRAQAALLAMAALFPVSEASAHHSFAAYDSTRTLTLTATVETFEWANPHAVLQVLAQENGADAQAEWDIDTSSPSILQRFGWKRDSVRRGDRVLVVLNPMKDGSHHGRLHTVTLLDTGRVLRTKLSGP